MNVLLCDSRTLAKDFAGIAGQRSWIGLRHAFPGLYLDAVLLNGGNSLTTYTAVKMLLMPPYEGHEMLFSGNSEVPHIARRELIYCGGVPVGLAYSRKEELYFQQACQGLPILPVDQLRRALLSGEENLAELLAKLQADAEPIVSAMGQESWARVRREAERERKRRKKSATGVKHWRP